MPLMTAKYLIPLFTMIGPGIRSGPGIHHKDEYLLALVAMIGQ